MADVSILTRFEVSLSEKVVQDLLNPGKTFENEIWKQNEGGEVQAGSSIMLQKLGDSMLKLLVTVYQPSQVAVAGKVVQNDGTMQTEDKKTDKVKTQTDNAEVESSSMQTDPKSTEVAPTQTDNATTESSFVQTEPKPASVKPTQTDGTASTGQKTQTETVNTDSSEMQTEVTKLENQKSQTENATLNDSFMQTEIKQFVDSSMQTDNEVCESEMQTDIMCFERFEQITQTSVDTSDTGVQMGVDMYDQDMQTDLEQADSECQTEKDECSRDTQTVIKEFNENDMQTDISMALQSDADCQAVVDQFDGECQAVVDLFDGECQASVEQQVGECQAVVDCSENECQAVVECSENESQVEIEQCEFECQVGPEVVESECQVEVESAEVECQINPEISEIDIQTDQSISLMQEGGCQTDQSLSLMQEGDCQTDQSLSLMQEGDCQTDQSLSLMQEGDCQTDQSLSLMQEGDCQTDQSLSLMQECECQTDASTLDSRSVCLQTEATKIKTRTVQTDPEEVEINQVSQEGEQTVPQHDPTQQQGQLNLEPGEIQQQLLPGAPGENLQQIQSINPDGTIAQYDIVHNPDGSQQILGEPPVISTDPNNPDIPTIVSIEPVGKNFKTEEPSIVSIEALNKGSKADPIEVEKMVEDSSCQTDPVTIIIGDASFLVQRLKSSSMRPAKVEGNEIEIEVGPESDKKNIFSPDPYHDMDEKPFKKRGTFGMRGNKLPRTPRIKKEKAVKKEKVVLPSIEELLPHSSDQGGPMPKLPPPGSTEIGKFSCPFCALTFHESPALYEHLQVDHSNITSAAATRSAKKAGKYRPKKKTSNLPPELEAHDDMIERVTEVNHEGEEPPILTPYEEGEMYQVESELPPPDMVYADAMSMAPKVRFPEDVYSDMPPGDDEGPGLFEDIPEPKGHQAKERKYGRQVKGVKPYRAQENKSNLEFDCPMCYEKFGTADILFLHIKRTHREEEEKRQRRDVVTALMHDTMSATGKRRMPLPECDIDSSKPVKRRRTKEVLEEFEETLVEEMNQDDYVEPLDPYDRLREVEEEEEGELPPPDLEINTEPPQLEGEEDDVPQHMLDEMVEVVVHEPGEEDEYVHEGGEGVELAVEAYEEGELPLEPEFEPEFEAESEPEEEFELEPEAEAEPEPEPEFEPEPEPEPVVEPPKKRGRPKKIPKDGTMQQAKGNEEEDDSAPSTSTGLRRTRHSLKGQGPPRPSPRTRGGRSGRP